MTPHSLDESLVDFAHLLVKAPHVVFFTGAGISVPSGIPDFRSENGIWSRYDPYTYASIQGFKQNTELVWDFLKKMYDEVGTKKPNPAHFALTEIQELLGHDKVTVITQNIDGLHQKAKTLNVVEFHGSFTRLVCLSCHTIIPAPNDVYKPESPLPRCPKCQAILKPDITFFGESPPQQALLDTQLAYQKSTLAVGVGTSLEVVPASLFFLQFPGTKALFNLTPIRYQHLIDYYFSGDVSDTLPLLARALRSVL